MSTYHLTKRNNHYYFRLRIPLDLRHIIYATEIKKTLKCKTYSAAKSLAKIWTYRTEEVFMLCRSQVLSPDQQIEVVSRLATLGIIKGGGWVNREGEAVVVESKDTNPRASREQARKLSNVINEYVQDRKCRWSSKTLVEYESIFQVVLMVAEDKDIKSYRRPDLIAFRDTILRLPPNLTKKSEYRDKSIKQIVEMSYKECISDKTANGYIVNLAAVFKWAVKQGYLEANCERFREPVANAAL